MKWEIELSQAIADQKKIEIEYNGAVREVAPHILGCSATGQLTVSTFQFHHSTNPMKNNQWRTFIVDNIESLKILDDTFFPRCDYNPYDKNFQKVVSQI